MLSLFFFNQKKIFNVRYKLPTITCHFVCLKFYLDKLAKNLLYEKIQFVYLCGQVWTCLKQSVDIKIWCMKLHWSSDMLANIPFNTHKNCIVGAYTDQNAVVFLWSQTWSLIPSNYAYYLPPPPNTYNNSKCCDLFLEV